MSRHFAVDPAEQQVYHGTCYPMDGVVSYIEFADGHAEIDVQGQPKLRVTKEQSTVLCFLMGGKRA